MCLNDSSSQHFALCFSEQELLTSGLFSLRSELDQSNNTEENPEGEEHPPADSENK